MTVVFNPGIALGSRPGFYPSEFSPLDGKPISPNELVGLKLWLDAADTATITESGGSVSQWDDKSSRGNDATQGTGANQPTTNASTLNGRNIIDFDGNDVLEVPNESDFDNQQLTMFVVGSGSGSFTGKCDPAVLTTGLSRRKLQFKNNGFTSGQDGQDVNFGTTAMEVRGIISRGNSDHTLIDDGVFSTSSTTLATDNPNNVKLEIGAAFGSVSDALTGSIAEIIYYNRALSIGEATAITNSLISKWGL